MPLPGNYSTRTVEGTILDLHSGNPSVGTITFTPELENIFIQDAGADTTIAPTQTQAVLDANGQFSVILGTTDDPDIDPNGWTYKVEIITTTAGGSTAERTVYSIQLPAGTSPVNLADLSPAVSTSGTTILVKSVNGVTPDASGNILLQGLLTILNRNSDFETNADGWEAVGGTVARSTAEFFSGTASLLLTPDGVTATVEARTDLTANGSPSIVVGETYQAAGWVNSPTGFSSVDIAIEWLNSVDAVVSTDASSTVDLLVDRWTYLSIRGTAPATAVKARITFRQAGTPAITDLLYIDDAILTVLSVPLTLDDLTDVVAGGATNNQVIRFNSVSGDWELSDAVSFNEINISILQSQPDRQVFTTGGTWNKPTGNLGGAPRYCLIQVVGGGGGGGGAELTGASMSAVGAGGAGGGYAESLLDASTLGASETVTVGTGGTGGVGGGAAATSGGSSSFGTHVVASGGSPGGVGAASTGRATAQGGDAGVGTTGQVLARGDDGSNGHVEAGVPVQHGMGGGTHLGGVRRISSVTTGANGNAGRQFGGGGSGAINYPNQGTNKTGGAGADGVVIVTTYF